MDKRGKENMLCGEITAFLSMIFFLILALVGTSLESARINVGKSFADRSMQNAMDSLYTEYCINLWEDYHLFFLEGEESEKEDKDYIRNRLYHYMEYTYDYGDFKLPSMDLLDMEIRQLEVLNITRADAYEGEILLHEILEYEKYQVDEEFLSGQKEMAEMLKEVNANMTVVEKQMEAEQEMAKVNLEVLEFISAVEGITVGKRGLQWKSNGLLQTEKYFVKQFCNANASKATVGINHETVWKSLNSFYINPVLMIEELEAEAKQLLSELENEEEQEKGSNASYRKLKRMEEKLIETTRGILEQTERAQRILSEIRTKQSVFIKETEEFEAVYKSQEPNLSAESQTAFKQELERLKSFAGLESNETDSMIARILKMETYIKKDMTLLKEILKLERTRIANNVESISSYIEKLAELKESIKAYQIQEMQFDYSSLIMGHDVKNPMEAFSEDYKNNLLKLVVDDVSQISKKAKRIKARGEQEMSSSEENGYFAGIEWNENKLDEQLKKVLLSYYIENHFGCYLKTDKEKETNLDYEREYILGGKLSDEDNLAAVIEEIVFLRTLFNYMYLITDTEKVEMAYCTAAALVGYSCMEPLVQLTKNLILFVWAAEEAVVDAAALLQEKEIPVFKTKSTFKISFEELLLFSRELVQQKAMEISENALGLKMDYQEYLNLLLNLTSKEQKLNGVMELIEDNMRIRYDQQFVFGNCIYGIEAEGEFFMEEKFVSLPFVQQLIFTGGEGFWINSHQSYCY